MKKTFLLAVAALWVFTACHDGVTPPPDNSAQERTVDLIVPAGFDWNTTRSVVCDVTAPHLSRVALSETPTGEPVAVFFAGGGSEQVVLPVPESVDRLYIRYDTAEGASAPEAVEVGPDRMSYTVSPSAKDYTGIVDGDQAETVNGEIYYPVRANGWGTMIFEDLWPAYGDYDFNDMVFNYKIQLSMRNKNMVEAMKIGIRIKAVGGSLPYDLYLQMSGVKGGEIDEIAPYYTRNAPDDTDLVQLNAGNPVKDPALLKFERIKTRANNPAGAIYVNTERGYEVPEALQTEVGYVVYFRNSVKLEDVTFDKFDFFLGRPEGDGLIEIHRGGFAPSPLGEAAYERLHGTSTNIDRADYYYSNDGLVWAINIPTDVQHAYENVDFLKAYPDFARWARSGGAEASDWYRNGVAANLVERR